MDRDKGNPGRGFRRGMSSKSDESDELSRANSRNQDIGKQQLARNSKRKSEELGGSHVSGVRVTARPLGHQLTRQANIVRNANKRDESSDEELAENDATPSGITYLSNIQTTVKAIRAFHFTDQQIEVLKRTPFWWLINSALEMDDLAVYKQFKKKNFIITRIIKRFERRGRQLGFKFGDFYMVPRRDDFVLIFGVRCGRRQISPGVGSVKITPFLERCFPAKIEHMAAGDGTHYKMTSTLLHDTLVEIVRLDDPEMNEDIGRLMHLYLLASFFMPNRSLCLNWRLTEYLVNFEEMCEYDWCSFILDDLMDDISRNRNLRIGACSIFLLFWLCEYTFIMKPVRGCSVFPRYLKWDLHLMGTVTDRMDFDDLIRHTDVKSNLIPTAEEQEKLNIEFITSDDELADLDDNVDIECDIVRDRLSKASKGKGKVEEVGTSADGMNQKMGSSYQCNTTGGQQSYNEFLNSAQEMPNFELFDELNNPPCVNRRRNCLISESHTPSAEVIGKSKSVDQASVSRPFCVSPISNDNSVGNNGMAIGTQNEQSDCLKDELEKAYKTISTLKTAAELSESAKIAIVDELLDEIKNLKNLLSESEQVRSRLGAFRAEDAKKIEKLAKERWQFQHELERERVAHQSLKEDKARLDLLEVEYNHRKFQLITENDRLSAQLATAMKVIQDAGLKFDGELTESSDRCVSMTRGAVGGKSEDPGVACGYVGAQSFCVPGNVGQSSGSYPGNNTVPVVSRANNLSGGVSSSFNGVNSLGVSSSHGNTISSGSSSFITPALIKKEPLSDAGCSSSHTGSASSEQPNSMIARVQDRTKLNARKKTDLGTPIPMALVVQPKRVNVPNEIRSMNVNRQNKAFMCTFPFVVEWLEEKFLSTRPCDSILELQNSQLPNGITLLDIEHILNGEHIPPSVVDTWGLLTSNKVAFENQSRANRVFVSRQYYLFHSGCWINIARMDLSGPYKARVSQFVDKKLDDALHHDLWIFPICTPGQLDPTTNEGNHWSLLQYYVTRGSWLFYNPMKPSEPSSDDHLLNAKILVNYVEKKLKMLAPKRRLPVLKKDFKSELKWSPITPQQANGTLDSGVVICSLLETLLRKSFPVDKNWTVEHGGEQRARMVNVLCDYMISTESTEINQQ